jgi:hypothetical protein
MGIAGRTAGLGRGASCRTIARGRDAARQVGALAGAGAGYMVGNIPGAIIGGVAGAGLGLFVSVDRKD